MNNRELFRFQLFVEAAYKGNIGFTELVKFYQVASNADMAKMEKIVKDEDFPAFKKLIKKVLGVDLI
jgi:hypothetical protein